MKFTEEQEKFIKENYNSIASYITEDKTIPVILISWCVDDILWRADDTNIVITKEQAQDVIQFLDHSHDCTYGITWEAIDSAIEYCIELSNK